eukprot:Clim_evm1s99 gene=Clim_evmTU1s99
MKLNMLTSSAYLLGITVVQAAPVEKTRRQSEACEGPQFPAELVNDSLWSLNLFDPSEYNTWMYLMNGMVDLRPLAKIVADKGTEFEEFMGEKVGNFVVTPVDADTNPYYLAPNGKVDPWLSMVYKLNAVTGPVLMAPFNVERTEANAGDWDSWWNALQDISPTNFSGAEYYCAPKDPGYRPWSVSFPVVVGTSNYDYRRQQTVDYTTSRVWDVRANELESNRNPTQRSFINPNTLLQCVDQRHLYSQTITQTTGASAENSYSTSTTTTKDTEVSAKASASFFGMGASVSSSIKNGLSKTAAQSTTQGASQSVEESETVEHEVTPYINSNAVLNVTIWTRQYEAETYFTGDVVYEPDRTGIQAWISSDARNPTYPLEYGMPTMIAQGWVTTPGQIRRVAELASKVIGAEWSDAFLNSLISPSVSGRGDSIAGTDVIVEYNECDIRRIPDQTVCTPELAEQFPPEDTSCGANMADVSSKSLPVPRAGLVSDCQSLVPVDGVKNRYQVIDNCA